MAALRNLVAKIRVPVPAALRSWRSQAPSLPKPEIEKALLVKNNIESVDVVDLRSNADLLAEHADKTAEAMSQAIEEQEVIGRKFCTVSYKFFGSAVVLGCIDPMLDYYWKDKTEPRLEFVTALEFPE